MAELAAARSRRAGFPPQPPQARGACRRRRRQPRPFKPQAAEGRQDGEKALPEEGALGESLTSTRTISKKTRCRPLAAIEAELQAQGAGDLRHHRRHLQAPVPPAGPQDIQNKLQQRRATCRRRRSASIEESSRKRDHPGDEVVLRLNQARIDALVEQLLQATSTSAICVSHEGRLMRLSESLQRHPRGLPQELPGLPNSIHCAGSTASRSSPPRAGRISSRATRTASRSCAPADPRAGHPSTELEIGEFRKIVQHGAEGRARRRARRRRKWSRPISASSSPIAKKYTQSRPAVPRPDPGRQYRPDEGGRLVRIPPRLQILHRRHLVDQAGDHPLHRRSGPHHPHPRAHADPETPSTRSCARRGRCSTRSAASRRRRNWPKNSACRWRRCVRS